MDQLLKVVAGSGLILSPFPDLATREPAQPDHPVTRPAPPHGLEPHPLMFHQEAPEVRPDAQLPGDVLDARLQDHPRTPSRQSYTASGDTTPNCSGGPASTS